MRSHSINERQLEEIRVHVQKNLPRAAFARNATREQIVDAVMGTFLLAIRKSIGAHVTRSINPPAPGQPHSEAVVQEIVRVVMANSTELFDPCEQVNSLIDAVIARREKLLAATMV
jgi:hypothetical protein